MSTTTVERPDIDGLTDALAAILDAIVAVRDARQGTASNTISAPPLRVLTISDLLNKEDLGHDYINDPVGIALRDGVREFGRTIAKFMTLDEMQALAERAADKQPSRFGFRMNVVDKRWDGIVDHRGATWLA